MAQLQAEGNKIQGYEIYSSFDFTYEVSGKNINIHIFFSRFDSMYDFVMVDDDTLTCGVFHNKKIPHKRNPEYKVSR